MRRAKKIAAALPAAVCRVAWANNPLAKVFVGIGRNPGDGDGAGVAYFVEDVRQLGVFWRPVGVAQKAEV